MVIYKILARILSPQMILTMKKWTIKKDICKGAFWTIWFRGSNSNLNRVQVWLLMMVLLK